MFDYEISRAIGVRADRDIFSDVVPQVRPIGQTSRGFSVLKFADYYGVPCSLQASSLAWPAAIWFGVDDAQPQIMAVDARRLGVETSETTGWVEYPIPAEVLLTTRMHLSQEQVVSLLPYLQKFAEGGSIDG